MDLASQIPIQRFMTADPVTLTGTSSLAEAYQKMTEHRVRHLPVVNEKGEVIGLFSHTDLGRAYPPRETEDGWYYDKSELERMSVAHFMTKEPITLASDQSLKDAAKLMASHKFGCVPVTLPKSKQLAGIITYIDILKRVAEYF